MLQTGVYIPEMALWHHKYGLDSRVLLFYHLLVEYGGLLLISIIVSRLELECSRTYELFKLIPVISRVYLEVARSVMLG